MAGADSFAVRARLIAYGRSVAARAVTPEAIDPDGRFGRSHVESKIPEVDT